MRWTEDEIARIKLWGLCSVHGLPLDSRRTETDNGNGSTSVTLGTFCRACDDGEPWPLEALLRP